jgi:hypothetical protein
MKALRALILALPLASLAVAQNYNTDAVSFNPIGYWQLASNFGDTSSHNATLVTNNVSFVTPNNPPCGAGSVALVGGPQTAVGGSQTLTLSSAASANFSFTTSSKFTAMAWVKTTGQALGVMPIVAKADPATSTGWGLLVDNGGNNGIASGLTQGSGRVAFGFFAQGNLALVIESVLIVNDGNWHLVAGSSDGTGLATGLHIYIDGVPVTTSILGSTGTGTVTNTAAFSIGNFPDGSLPFEGNIAGVAVFNTTLTPAQLTQLSTDAGIAKAILSQFAFGGGWYSAVYFTNTGPGTVSFTVSFTGDSGNPLIVPPLTTGSTVVTLGPGASTIIEGLNSGALQEGYVTAYLPVGVTGYGLFRQSVPGIADQEAVVPLDATNFGTEFLTYDETNGLVTAVAIVNSINVPITITMTVTDHNGNVVGTNTLPPLAPFTKIENVLNAYVPAITGTRGSVTFSSPQSGMSVIGIRFKGAAFSSIPGLSGRQTHLYQGVL